MTALSNVQITQNLKPYGLPDDFDLPQEPDVIVDAEYILENNTPSTALVPANDNNNFPTFPSDPVALVPAIAVATKVVEAETELLKKLVVKPDEYKRAYKII